MISLMSELVRNGEISVLKGGHIEHIILHSALLISHSVLRDLMREFPALHNFKLLIILIKRHHLLFLIWVFFFIIVLIFNPFTLEVVGKEIMLGQDKVFQITKVLNCLHHCQVLPTIYKLISHPIRNWFNHIVRNCIVIPSHLLKLIIMRKRFEQETIIVLLSRLTVKLLQILKWSLICERLRRFPVVKVLACRKCFYAYWISFGSVNLSRMIWSLCV
jgi:hypothetical protein